MIAGISTSPVFLEHIAEYGLNFGTKEEFEFRQTIFLRKDAGNKDENSNPANTFTVGHNFMSTWTDAEYSRMLGFIPPPAGEEPEPTLLDTVGIPASVDWRREGAVNPVKHQGCGDCWIFGSTAVTEGRLQIASGKLFSLSE